MHKTLPPLGSISHGTLNSDDLIDAFMATLDELVEALSLSDDGQETVEFVGYAYDVMGMVERERTGGPDDFELVDALSQVLSEFAASGTYFGAHEGDGSDFGFWPDIDYLSEINHVGDPCELDTMGGSEAVYVNDHGNMTFYFRDGDGWTILWDCV